MDTDGGITADTMAADTTAVEAIMEVAATTEAADTTAVEAITEVADTMAAADTVTTDKRHLHRPLPDGRGMHADQTRTISRRGNGG